MTFQTDKILFMGGVNYDCFLAAIARPIHLAKAEAARDSAAITRLQAEAKAYMHHPVEWYRFNTTLLQYDLSTKAWSDLGEYEQFGPCRSGSGYPRWPVNYHQRRIETGYPHAASESSEIIIGI